MDVDFNRAAVKFPLIATNLLLPYAKLPSSHTHLHIITLTVRSGLYFTNSLLL